MTKGSITALASPWGMWNSPPRLWAMLWVSPRPLLLKAMPAMHDARSIISRASMSSPQA